MRHRSIKSAVLALAAFAVGFQIHAWGIHKPERLLELYAKYVEGSPNRAKRSLLFEGIHPGVQATNFDEIIDIETKDDIAARRRAVADYIWRGFNKPFGVMPDGVERNIKFPPLFGIANLASVDRLTISMPYGINSVAFVLKPVKSSDCLMVYQEGHGASFLKRRSYLEKVVAEGCTAVALSLPLTGGINSQPTINHPRFGVLNLLNTDSLEILHTQTFSAMGYYVSPPIVALNHVLAEGSYERVGMTGFSGGGWVTVIVAALDPRIRNSYPVAGTAPVPVFASEPGWGTWTQRDGRLYEIATYTELYVMGADEPGRRQLQIFNLNDECCFRGRDAEAYSPAVHKQAKALGGAFSALIREDEFIHEFFDGAQVQVLTDFLGSSVAGKFKPPA